MHLRRNRDTEVLQFLPVVLLAHNLHQLLIIVALQLPHLPFLHDPRVVGRYLRAWVWRRLGVLGEDRAIHARFHVLFFAVVFDLFLPFAVLSGDKLT